MGIGRGRCLRWVDTLIKKSVTHNLEISLTPMFERRYLRALRLFFEKASGRVRTTNNCSFEHIIHNVSEPNASKQWTSLRIFQTVFHPGSRSLIPGWIHSHRLLQDKSPTTVLLSKRDFTSMICHPWLPCLLQTGGGIQSPP
jgi:hypothetical protein